MVSSSGPDLSRRVTIHDVARSAGVSRQTVSRALNGKGEIERSTKQRVLDAARELGYRPSRFARGLVRQDTTTIGLVIPDLRNPFFTEVAASALESARARGWHVVVYDTADRPEEELGTLQVIGSQVDGVVGYFSCDEDELDRYTRGMPMVLIGREHRMARFSSIRIDGEDGVRAAVAYLVAKGHTMIGMLDHDNRAEPSLRRDWFTAAMLAHGIDPGRVAGAGQLLGRRLLRAREGQGHPPVLEHRSGHGPGRRTLEQAEPGHPGPDEEHLQPRSTRTLRLVPQPRSLPPAARPRRQKVADPCAIPPSSSPTSTGTGSGTSPFRCSGTAS